MKINSITFSGYRNLESGAFYPGKNVNILTGRNAQGKTNLIEAVWLFTGARSFRGSKDSELIRIGSGKAEISLDFDAAGRNQQIRLTIENGRHAVLNGVSLESPVRLSGEFCAVIFSPEHLGLVKDGPQIRRRFLDSAICQLKPRHAGFVVEYKKALSQRNALLKDIPRHSELMDTLDVWDERLCRTGARIIHTRLGYLELLGKKASETYAGIAKKGESLEIGYLDGESGPYAWDSSNPSAPAELYEQLSASMKRSRMHDIEAGYTHAGPHRDDLEFLIDGLSARSFGSQGQQRSVVLSLKLAEASVLWKTVGEPPVLLLDDVMSELDQDRQDYLLNHIEGMQVFITCCEPSAFQKLGDGRIFRIEAGRLIEKDFQRRTETEDF